MFFKGDALPGSFAPHEDVTVVAGGARGNSRPYRESWTSGASGPLLTHMRHTERRISDQEIGH
jgi:hypothetical protein